MSLGRQWRTLLRALVIAACALSPVGCASWNGPRIDPSGQRILVWPGQTPPPTTPPPPPPGTILVPPPGTSVVGPATSTPPPSLVTTPPPPVVTTTPPPPPPTIGLPQGNLQAPPVYPDAGVPASPPPIITTPPPPTTSPGAAPIITTPTAAAPVALPPPPVDAQFAFPAPTIAQVGHPLILTTLVTRRTDRVPLAGWTVRYEVTNTGAALGSSGANRVEVPTDASGRASIEISPLSTSPGEAVVNMVAIAPAELTTGPTSTAEVARGTATITWRNGVPGAPAWAPQPLAMSGGMPAPSLVGPGLPPPPDTAASAPPQPYSSSDRAPNRFEPPPSLSNDDGPKRTYAPPPTSKSSESAPVGKPELAVEVRLRNPGSVEVGGYANFDVLVSNRGAAVARNVKVIDQFDEGLTHIQAQPGKRAVEYNAIGQLPPGESRSVALTFGVHAAGQLCHEVTVSADDAASVVERGCVQGVEPKPVGQPVIEVTKQGPRRHYVGELALFSVVIKNSGEVPVTNLVINDRYDPSLDPRSMTAGASKQADDSLEWRISRMEVGERREFKVSAACISPSNSACSAVTVTGDGGILIGQQRCVEILPALGQTASPPGGVSPPPAAGSDLKLTLQSTANPARVGVPAILYVFVENVGRDTQRQVRLRVQLPPEAAPIAGEIDPAGEIVGAFEVRFANIGDIAPGERRQVKIPYSPTAARVVTFSALVEAYGMTQPISTESAPIQIEAAAQ